MMRRAISSISSPAFVNPISFCRSEEDYFSQPILELFHVTTDAGLRSSQDNGSLRDIEIVVNEFTEILEILKFHGLHLCAYGVKLFDALVQAALTRSAGGSKAPCRLHVIGSQVGL